ncbi:NAD/ferredoxin-dependent reductase-like protein [Solirubrobacter pauli]|uniref:NAD/ferredoxin-dependent reductase-like protein n=1 Tax=Solirubrobacter pauli TaxID=166793 RepID=A0A660KZ35_9ACTN|nr:FAD-dependent oxidoreductase [Solirubrobacter pauli]RKQ86418.1 NAD/ferredoxin-dependent reductase-like protein [Solirubrobacter pauli]
MSEREIEYLIVGGGDAGFSAARTLREEGATGSVLVVSRDPDPPYDRTAVSKGFLGGEKSRSDVLLGGEQWFTENDVELLTRTSAMKLDIEAHTVTLSNKDVVRYGKLLLATGANVRRLRVDGADLDGIHYLRALGNADAIREDAKDNVVLVGGSYIATEVAATLSSMGRKCTLVMQEDVTLERTFGKTAGGFFQKALTDHGVTIYGGEEVARFEGEGRVSAVVTASGKSIPADAVVVGVGVSPDVSLAKKAGLEIGERGGVLTDAKLATSAVDVYAAGDIAEYDSVVHQQRVRIEHWDVAENQGKTAARSMLGHEDPHDVVPYFFSDLSDWAWFEYVGPAYTWTEEVVRGSIDEGKFTVWYLDGDRLAGALAVDRSDDLDLARELIKSRAPVDRAALAAT